MNESINQSIGTKALTQMWPPLHTKI